LLVQHNNESRLLEALTIRWTFNVESVFFCESSAHRWIEIE